MRNKDDAEREIYQHCCINHYYVEMRKAITLVSTYAYTCMYTKSTEQQLHLHVETACQAGYLISIHLSPLRLTTTAPVQ